MRRTIWFMVLIFSFCLVFASIAAAGENETKSRYDVLLERVKKGDTTVDFRALRLTYAETPQYIPYGGATGALIEAMYSANKDKQYSKAIEYAEKILKDNYVNIDAHMTASVAYRSLGEQDKADYHRFVAKGLAKSIMASDDGTSPKTAFNVISVDEEYVLLSMLGLKTSSQSKLQIDGHRYDKHTVVDLETNKLTDLYFCIDIPYNWMEKQIKK